jgi:tyrosyl-tRNA synthetase
MKLSDELAWRGFVNQTTFNSVEDINTPRTFYLGVDPSSDSMQIGNLAAVMLVKHLVKAGHKAVVLVGGATGMIGDPKDDEERVLKSLDEIAKNKAGIAAQYKQILDGDEFELVDNYDWFKDIKFLDFLREIGKNFSMTQLLDRDFVQSRIGEDKAGISFAEFSYSLIQGYDFLHLFREKGVTLQIGGSDQWGNMLSGVPLIRKLADGEAHVWTLPLIINKATGKKFGKSEQGTVWLDPTKTSPFKFYQFWLNCDDAGVEDYLKVYTLIKPEELEALMTEFKASPQERAAQKYLAFETTKLMHGAKRAESVKNVSEVLFGQKQFSELSDEDLDELSSEIPTTHTSNIIEVLVATGLAASNGEARRLIQGNAISINGQKVTEDSAVHAPSLIKKGKNSFALIR